ncbi:winged helix-turn-helix transcriptional regulator [Streptosporangiaceae bacterium NEAU-GS5]|nr:winged helix-turn-helix transcriptional regulator [Streptosporangiaceae bacterium NEAU-GS5]
MSSPGSEIDAALFRLRRMWSRPGRGRTVQMSNVMVIHAVQRLSACPGEVTVGAVAEALDVDPSTASRLVNDALTAGFVRREASQVDARRARLVLTETGARVLEAVIRHRRAYLDRLIADWEPQERQALARTLTRLADAAAAHPGDPAVLDDVVAEALGGKR